MDDIDPARREHIRRWVRPDFERFLRPDWERYVTPAGRERRWRQIAEYKAAFEPWQARRLREENEAREREAQAALEAEHQWEIEYAALELKAELAALRVQLMWAQLCRKAGFNPDQPRDEQGRWTDGGGETVSDDDSNAHSSDDCRAGDRRGRWLSPLYNRRAGQCGTDFEAEASANFGLVFD